MEFYIIGAFVVMAIGLVIYTECRLKKRKPGTGGGTGAGSAPEDRPDDNNDRFE